MKLIYTTCESEEEARSLATQLLEKKHIACANYFPMRSVYRWKGEIQNGTEVILILKTSDDHAQEVQQQVVQLHSYETPCVLILDATANTLFNTWVSDELTQ